MPTVHPIVADGPLPQCSGYKCNIANGPGGQPLRDLQGFDLKIGDDFPGVLDMQVVSALLRLELPPEAANVTPKVEKQQEVEEEEDLYAEESWSPSRWDKLRPLAQTRSPFTPVRRTERCVTCPALTGPMAPLRAAQALSLCI